MIGVFGVNTKPKSSDHYYKGALMLHTLRHTFKNDNDWWKTLKLFTETFAYQIIESKDVIDFFQKHTDWNVAPFFEQYLQHPEIPKLSIRSNKNRWEVSFITNVSNFQMPIQLEIDGKLQWKIIKNQPLRIKAKNIQIPNEKYYLTK
jgi:aminopeptidase N